MGHEVGADTAPGMSRGGGTARETVFRGGEIVTPDGVRRADLLVRGSVIRSIKPGIRARGAKEIDSSGMLVFPGGVDVHTHLGLSPDGMASQEDWYQGTVAAACGGTTTIVEHPGFGPAGCPLSHQIDAFHKLAQDSSAVDYSFHAVVQHVDKGIAAAIATLPAQGITSAKVYLTYDFRLEESEILTVLERMREAGGITAAHCESHEIVSGLRERFREEGKLHPRFHPLSRPAEAEAEAVSCMARLAEKAGALLYVVHLSSAAGLEEVRRARARGVALYAETCPQYLLLDEKAYDEPDLGGLKYMMSPPLRKASDREALWAGLADGSVSTVATDHCAFSLGMKRERSAGSFLDCPNGAPGVETRIPLMFSEAAAKGRLDPVRCAQACSTAPARLMGLYPKKGALMPGSDADIVMIDPAQRVLLTNTMLHQNTDYTPFEGMALAGYPVLTMLRGRVIYENGNFLGGSGGGEFIYRGRPVPPQS